MNGIRESSSLLSDQKKWSAFTPIQEDSKQGTAHCSHIALPDAILEAKSGCLSQQLQKARQSARLKLQIRLDFRFERSGTALTLERSYALRSCPAGVIAVVGLRWCGTAAKPNGVSHGKITKEICACPIARAWFWGKAAGHGQGA